MKPKNWKSLKTGNEFPCEKYCNIDEIRGRLKPLPKDEYPYTLTYYEKEKPEWQK